VGNLHAAFDPKSAQLLSVRELKILNVAEKMELTTERIKDLEREVTRLTKFQHRNVVPHFGMRSLKADKGQVVEIFSGPLPGDSLQALLRKYGALLLNKACEFGQKLLTLMVELHDKQITFKGFDSSMVFFDDSGEVVLLGLGYHRLLADLVREDILKIPKGESLLLPWAVPEPMDWTSLPAVK